MLPSHCLKMNGFYFVVDLLIFTLVLGLPGVVLGQGVKKLKRKKRPQCAIQRFSILTRVVHPNTMKD